MAVNDLGPYFVQVFSKDAVIIICDSQKVCRESRKLRDLRRPRLVDAKQPSDCMQRIHVVEIGAIVTNALRTGWHLDGSHGVRDGGR